MPQERKHLRRLAEVWVECPVYFITTCAHGRAPRLATAAFHALAQEVWRNCERHYGWVVGRYVIMPDHVHFFTWDVRGQRSLSHAVGKWKEWTAKYSAARLAYAMPLWQPEFFDHVLRSSESYEQKYVYTQDNPVRAGLVARSAEWLFQGELTSREV